MKWTSNIEHLSASRALAVGVFIIVFLLIFYLFSLNFVAPLWQQQEEFSSTLERVRRVQALISKNEELQADLVNMRRSLAAHTGFLREESESLATSVFQSQIQEIILRHGGTVNSFSSGRSILETDELVELNVRISFMISYRGFVAVVEELEHIRNDINISSISVHVQTTQPNQTASIVARLLATSLYIPDGGFNYEG